MLFKAKYFEDLKVVCVTIENWAWHNSANQQQTYF